MKITLALTESIYDCKIEIKDSQGVRDYFISALEAGENGTSYITAEVFDSDFDLKLTPMTINIKPTLDELEDTSWKDKFAKKIVDAFVSIANKMMLQVECMYRAENVQENDRIDINLQTYVFGKFDRFDLLELIPAAYTFFEASNFNLHYKLFKAKPKNRKEVMKSAKVIASTDMLGNGFFGMLITYPIQVTRMRYITSDKIIVNSLIKFNNLSEEKRQKFLDKQDKFFDKC